MQMLYDAMFENIFTGLPIVNSLVRGHNSLKSVTNMLQATTEIQDESLYFEVGAARDSENVLLMYCIE